MPTESYGGGAQGWIQIIKGLISLGGGGSDSGGACSGAEFPKLLVLTLI